MGESVTSATAGGDDAAAEERTRPPLRCHEPSDELQRVFEVLGKRWSGLLIAALINGPGGFAELRRSVAGISERMLSDRLAELVDLGLVSRAVDPGPPLRVLYRLTDSGDGLRPALAELTQWAEEYLPSAGARCPEEFRRPTDPSGR